MREHWRNDCPLRSWSEAPDGLDSHPRGWVFLGEIYAELLAAE